MAALLPHRDRRCREGRIGESADGDGDVAREAFARPIHRGATHRTEAERQRIAACGCARPLRHRAGEGDLVAGKARLVAEHGTGAPLALEAVAHGDAHRLAFNREVELAAIAGGVSGGHGFSNAPRAGVIGTTGLL